MTDEERQYWERMAYLNRSDAIKRGVVIFVAAHSLLEWVVVLGMLAFLGRNNPLTIKIAEWMAWEALVALLACFALMYKADRLKRAAERVGKPCAKTNTVDVSRPAL